MKTETYESLVEVNDILDSIYKMKDATLDCFYEDKNKASKLMIDLTSLEQETEMLISELEELAWGSRLAT